MKYVILVALAFCLSSLSAQQVEWLSFEEAVERSRAEPRKMLIDVYTKWCGWCKKMDKSVFADPAVAKYISENFYAVKLDAEQKEDINYADTVFKFDQNAGRRGAHQFAAVLLDGRMSYPSIVYLDEQRDRITISPGFKPVKSYLKELRYVREEHYKTTSYQDFSAGQGK